ncbi:MAG: hypothetical protein COA94_05125 [Rickettsiales bacterium]|nr:MAG: hypothetical protein COA94_05125 [Rickettsiales bacterium]
MAEKIAPYVQPIPKFVLETNNQEFINWFSYDNLWKQDINVNLGFGDAITNVTNSESFETSSASSEYQAHKRELEQIEDLIPTTQVRELYSKIVTANYTAVNNDFCDIRNGSTVTLDSNAGWNDQIITTNGDGSSVKVTSTIELRYKGQRGNTITIRQEGTSIHWYLFSDGTEKFWRAS